MIAFTVRRLVSMLARLALAVVLLVLAAEIAMLCARSQGEDDSGHAVAELVKIYQADAPRGLHPVESTEPIRWWQAVVSGFLNSGRILVLVLVITVAFGPVIGLLVARFRNIRLLEVLVFPFFLGVCLPGFWAACVAVWWLIEKWGQPGFVKVAGPVDDLLTWWSAFVPAAIVSLGVIGWQIRSVADGIKRAARKGYVRGAMSRGESGAPLFYRHVFRSALEPFLRCLDRSLPIMLGSLILVEWVFRYPGLGRLMVESAREGHFPGLIGGGFVMAVIVVLVRFLGEMAHGLLDRRSRPGIAGVPALSPSIL